MLMCARPYFLARAAISVRTAVILSTCVVLARVAPRRGSYVEPSRQTANMIPAIFRASATIATFAGNPEAVISEVMDCIPEVRKGRGQREALTAIEDLVRYYRTTPTG